MNQGVSVVSNDCVYKKCGLFNGRARLEVPYFSNNWARYNEFSFSLFFKRNSSNSNEQGILSNDCFNNIPYKCGNSLYVSSDSGEVNSGLKSPNAQALGLSVGLLRRIH